MSIPVARDKLFALGRDLASMGQPWARNAIAKIIREEMYRKKYKSKKAKVTARRMTPALATHIRLYIKKYPDLSNREIGRRLNVDGGRVSEARAKMRR